MPKGSTKATLINRQQVAEAVLQGFLDAAIAADLSTAKTNGYVPGKIDDSEVGGVVQGVNR